MISIDGLPPAVYTGSGDVMAPTLKRLASEGAFASGVVGVFPTVTYPAHATLLTGVPPAIHGIYNNRILDPEDQSNGAWYWYARDVKAPTLASAVHNGGGRVAAINWPTSVGMDIDFLLPDLARSDHPESLNLLRSLSKPAGLIDDFEDLGGLHVGWPLTDTVRAEMAASVIRAHRPDLLLLYLYETDTAQHVFGPHSPEARTAFEVADRQVAQVLAALDATGMRQRTDVVIVSDHGFLTASKRLQLNAAFKREGWLRVDASGRIIDWAVYFQPANGSGFVFLKDPQNETLRREVAHLLATLANDPENGIDRVMLKDELTALGADPRASFAVDMRSGFAVGIAHDGLLEESDPEGVHGFYPFRAELHASLIMNGPDVHESGDLGIVRMTQIAPTVASWLGVALSAESDLPIAVNNSARKPATGRPH